MFRDAEAIKYSSTTEQQIEHRIAGRLQSSRVSSKAEESVALQSSFRVDPERAMHNSRAENSRIQVKTIWTLESTTAYHQLLGRKNITRSLRSRSRVVKRWRKVQVDHRGLKAILVERKHLKSSSTRLLVFDTRDRLLQLDWSHRPLQLDQSRRRGQLGWQAESDI